MTVYKKENSDSVCLTLNQMYRECSDARNDGWTAFGYKKELLRIHFHLENLLNRCPTFVDEQKFVESIQKEITWNTLKNDFR